ncbi:PPM-type phosphatase domain-containing protein [Mycena kentingensis (nom. inval.)]|nr:PPM-type phosphatase domain-containing protein [Mycena kentingensis (nom. inval.)]
MSTVPRGVHCHARPNRGEDRTVVLPFEHGTLVAIFDGHYSDQLSDFASRYLPRAVADAFNPTSDLAEVERQLVHIFTYFDQWLLSRVTKRFDDANWLDKKWDNRDAVYDMIGWGVDDPEFIEARRAVVGTTVLVGIIDKAKEHVWVVSLGDSNAVRGRMEGERMVPLVMNELHNCWNEDEVRRLLKEHPGERQVVHDNHVLGALAVTRALGDHQMKTDIALADRILGWLYPSPISLALFGEWKCNGNLTPPYLSATPSVRKFDLKPGDVLVFASDGLADSLDWLPQSADPAEAWDVILGFLTGHVDPRLGHDIIPLSDAQDTNNARLLVENVLHGSDESKKARLSDKYIDDISVFLFQKYKAQTIAHHFSMTGRIRPGIHEANLPTRGEDRTVILPFDHGTLVAIFDGHHSADLSEYAAQSLPQLIAESFGTRSKNISDFEADLRCLFEDFDSFLIDRVRGFFEKDADWLDEKWNNTEHVYNAMNGRNDRRDGRTAIVGTTALVGIINKAKTAIWIISLGDSYAVCGRTQEGVMVPLVLSEHHNTSNAMEVERLAAEHPGERDLISNNAVLGVICVTRAFGDHQLKVELPFAERILKLIYPPAVPPTFFDVWRQNGNLTPPYISSIPTVRKFDLQPGDQLVFASDGLSDSMDWVDQKDRWEVIMSLLDGKDDARLGHQRLPAGDDDNRAESLIWNVLFGSDEEKKAKESGRRRDDISVVVVDVAAIA